MIDLPLPRLPSGFHDVFVPAAGEAAGPPGIPRECLGGPAASPAAGTNGTWVVLTGEDSGSGSVCDVGYSQVGIAAMQMRTPKVQSGPGDVGNFGVLKGSDQTPGRHFNLSASQVEIFVTKMRTPKVQKGSPGGAGNFGVLKGSDQTPGRHFNLGASKVEIAKYGAHALNRTRDLRIMRKR